MSGNNDTANQKLIIWNKAGLIPTIFVVLLLSMSAYYSYENSDRFFFLIMVLVIILFFLIFVWKVTTISSEGVEILRIYGKKKYVYNEIELVLSLNYASKGSGPELYLYRKSKEKRKLVIRSFIPPKKIDFYIDTLKKIENCNLRIDRPSR